MLVLYTTLAVAVAGLYTTTDPHREHMNLDSVPHTSQEDQNWPLLYGRELLYILLYSENFLYLLLKVADFTDVRLL